MKSIEECKVIQLPRIENRKGNITPVHPYQEVPFDIKRIFYIYDIPGGKSRGAHSHRELHQFIVSILGSFEVLVDDGIRKKRIRLNRSYKGLYIPPLIWAAEMNFSSGSICLVLTSDFYKEEDYIRDYEEYLTIVKKAKSHQGD